MNPVVAIGAAAVLLACLRIIRRHAHARLEHLESAVHVDRRTGLAGRTELDTRIESERRRIDRLGGSLSISVLRVPSANRRMFVQHVGELLSFPGAAFRLDDDTFAILEVGGAQTWSTQLVAERIADLVDVPVATVREPDDKRDEVDIVSAACADLDSDRE